MLSIAKYPEQYALHFPAIFYLLCCASQHHVSLLEKLKGLLKGETPSGVSPAECTLQVNQLMRELHDKKRLGLVKLQGGQFLLDPTAIASALEEHWSAVTKPGFADLDEC